MPGPSLSKRGRTAQNHSCLTDGQPEAASSAVRTCGRCVHTRYCPAYSDEDVCEAFTDWLDCVVFDFGTAARLPHRSR